MSTITSTVLYIRNCVSYNFTVAIPIDNLYGLFIIYSPHDFLGYALPPYNFATAKNVCVYFPILLTNTAINKLSIVV